MNRYIDRSLAAWRRWTSASAGRRIIGAALTVAVVSIAPRGATIAKDLVVAHRFGTTSELDVYLVALILPLFAATVVSSSISLAVIPAYVRVRVEGVDTVRRFVQNVVVLVAFLATGVALLIVAVEPLALPALISHLGASSSALIRQLYFELLPYIVITSITTVFGAILNANSSFGVTSFSPALTPLITIVLLVISQHRNIGGAHALVLGLVLGACAELVVTAAALRACGIPLTPRWHGLDRHTRDVLIQYAPMAGTAVFAAASPLVDQSMAATLGPGSVSAINYGSKLVTLAIALAYVPLNAATLPHLSNMVVAKDWSGIRHALLRGSLLLLVATVPPTVAMMVLSRPLIAFIFERGAFTAADTHVVAMLMTLYAAQVPLYLVSVLPMRLLSAMRKNHLVMSITLSNVALNAIADWSLKRWIGLSGIALSSAIVCFSSCVLAFGAVVFLLRRLPRT